MVKWLPRGEGDVFKKSDIFGCWWSPSNESINSETQGILLGIEPKKWPY